MFDSLLPTKLYRPPNRPDQVARPRLLAKLAVQPQTKLLLISAAAGYGKTTLLTSWLSDLRFTIYDLRLEESVARQMFPRDASIVNLQSKIQNQICWLSLDEEDSTPQQFFAYVAAAIRPLANVQTSLPQLLQANPPLPATALAKLLAKAFVQDVAPVTEPFVLVLDDYHRLDAPAIDAAITFVLEHMPPQMLLVIATREDPTLPLARLRVRHELVELRAQDLRFTPDETAVFLNQIMGLSLTTADIAALEARTEGWIAGLQLAALALQSQGDKAGFIESFSGGHRFVLDYLVEEVLQQQPEPVQIFLRQTAVLDRLCAPLCDAILGNPAGSGADTLAHLEQANLFLIPLDDQRRWYRYHHLFGDLLRQRLQQQEAELVNTLHLRASQWYEAHDLELEAFQHATAAGDIDRAERLIDAKPTSLQFRGGAIPILNWLKGLETAVLDAHPALWVTYASTLLAVSQLATVKEKAQAAENALEGAEPTAKNRDLSGRIASIRAAVAVAEHDAETILTQAQRAQEYLDPANHSVRTSISWSLGYAHQLRGDYAAASRAYADAQARAKTGGHKIMLMMSTLGIGNMQEAENQLGPAAQTYEQLLQAIGEPLPLPMCEAFLGLARVHYEWNELEAAHTYWEKNVPLAQQFGLDRAVMSDLFLVRLRLARGETSAAAALLDQVWQTAVQHQFRLQIGEAAALRVRLLLAQGAVETAVSVAQDHDLPLSQARVYLGQADPAAALALLEPLNQQWLAKKWGDKRLKVLVLLALAHEARGDGKTAVRHLHDALTQAEPHRFVRTFVDEGAPMATLLRRVRDEANLGQSLTSYIDKLLAAFGTIAPAQPLLDPLSERELEVLRLIAEGLSNREIGGRLFLAMDTVKGHNRRIFAKLGVRRRTEAVAQARALGLL